MERREREPGRARAAELVDELAALAPSSRQRILIDVHRRAAAAVTPASVLRRYRVDRFAGPGGHDGAAVARVLAAALELLPTGYATLTPAPVAPLGTVAALTGRDQSGVLATERALEIVADTACALALEAAVRRDAARSDPVARSEPVRLAASQRVLRTQPFPAPYRQHFELLALCTAGAAAPGFGFEAAGLVEQAGYYAGLAATLLGDGASVRVEVADLDRPGRATRLEDTVCAPLRALHPRTTVVVDADRRRGAGYYGGAAFRIAVRAGGDEIELADGGVADWTQRLLGDRRERLVVSGLGVEQLAAAVSRGPRRAGAP
jgi:hypothetical protein